MSLHPVVNDVVECYAPLPSSDVKKDRFIDISVTSAYLPCRRNDYVLEIGLLEIALDGSPVEPELCVEEAFLQLKRCELIDL
jgi:hypothetical protein